MNRLIENMPDKEYRAVPAISKSGLDWVEVSPAHYKWHQGNPGDETAAFVFGRAFHTMILEPEKVSDSIVVMPESWPTKKECGFTQEEQKESFRHTHQHKAILTGDQMCEARAMAKSVEEHPASRFLLNKANGKAEVSLFWRDPVNDVDCKSRFDWLRNDGLIVDLKTTRCAKPGDFEKLAYDHRYHVQAAFYMEAYRQVTGNEPAGFAFVAVEKEPPYPACVYLAQPDFLELGRREWERDLKIYAECLRKDEWPAYPDIQLVQLNLTKYAAKQLTEGVLS